MNIDKISSNPNNQSFKALHISRKALKNTGYLTKKSLLKNAPSLAKVAEKAEVVIKNGEKHQTFASSPVEKAKAIGKVFLATSTPLIAALSFNWPAAWIPAVFCGGATLITAVQALQEEILYNKNKVDVEVYPLGSEMKCDDESISVSKWDVSYIRDDFEKLMNFANKHFKGEDVVGSKNIKQDARNPLSSRVKKLQYLTTSDNDGFLPMHYSLEEVKNSRKNLQNRVLAQLLLSRNCNGDLPIHTYLKTHDFGDEQVVENLRTFLNEVPDMDYEESTLKAALINAQTGWKKYDSIFVRYNSPKYKGCQELFKQILGEENYEKTTEMMNSVLAERMYFSIRDSLVNGAHQVPLDDIKEFNRLAKNSPDILEKFYTKNTSAVQSTNNGRTIIYAFEDEDGVLEICEALKEYPRLLAQVWQHKNDFAKVSVLSQYIKNERVEPYIKSCLYRDEYNVALVQYEKDKELALTALQNDKIYDCGIPNEQLARYFRVLGQENPKAIVDYLNKPVKQTTRAKFCLGLPYGTIVPLFDTINSVLKNRTDLLSEIYLTKNRDDDDSLLQGLLMRREDVVFNFVDTIKLEAPLLKLSLGEAKNALTKAQCKMNNNEMVKFIEKFISVVKDNIEYCNLEINDNSPKPEFNSPKPFIEILSNPMVVKSKGKALLAVKSTSISPVICDIADLFITDKNKDDYMKMIESLKKLPNIDYNQSDIMGIPFIEKVLNSENELLFDIVKDKEFEYYPILDKVFERISGEEFKEKAAKLNIKFPDIEEAVRVSSIEALDALAEQFKSPFFNKKYAKKIMHQATKSKPEFMMYLATAYKDYLPEYALEYFTGLQVARNQNQ